MTFGLITEGPTDQFVLRNLLARFFSDLDIDTRAVQPSIDETNNAGPGGWQRVLNYCKSPDIVTALEVYDFLIIQIDTDVCQDYGVPTRKDGEDVIDTEIVQGTKNVIIETIGTALYSQYEQKIIFAISHSSIECWLLPLYYNDNKRTKTTNCCDTLNQELRKIGFTIDCNSKKAPSYHKICKEIKNKGQIETMAAHNNSFSQFVHSLSLI